MKAFPQMLKRRFRRSCEARCSSGMSTGAYANDLANEIADVDVRGALRDRGYFRASAEARLTELWNEGADIGVLVAVAATLGPQYRAGDIRLKSADPDSLLAISPEVLRSLIPLQRGEPFSTERVRAGLENIGRAYGREAEVDGARGTVDLTVRIDQQVQYRVGSIEFLGVIGATREKLMESVQKPGEIFDVSRLNEFFKANQPILPAVPQEIRCRSVMTTKQEP